MVSALLVQRQLSMRHHETAFVMLRKIPCPREPLKGELEVDAWVGWPQARLRGSRARGRRVQARPSQPTLRTHLKGCEVGCGVVGHW